MLTGLLSADSELLARFTAANLIEGVHADAVHGCWMQVHNVGLVDGGRDVACRLLEVPGICRQNTLFKSQPVKLQDPSPASNMNTSQS